MVRSACCGVLLPASVLELCDLVVRSAIVWCVKCCEVLGSAQWCALRLCGVVKCCEVL